jgi:hypothetical protein
MARHLFLVAASEEYVFQTVAQEIISETPMGLAVQ